MSFFDASIWPFPTSPPGPKRWVAGLIGRAMLKHLGEDYISEVNVHIFRFYQWRLRQWDNRLPIALWMGPFVVISKVQPKVVKRKFHRRPRGGWWCDTTTKPHVFPDLRKIITENSLLDQAEAADERFVKMV